TTPAASVSVPVRVPFATSWPALLSAKLVIVATPERVPPAFVVPATGVVNEVEGGAAVAVPAVRASTAKSATSAPERASLVRTRASLLRATGRPRLFFSLLGNVEIPGGRVATHGEAGAPPSTVPHCP